MINIFIVKPYTSECPKDCSGNCSGCKRLKSITRDVNNNIYVECKAEDTAAKKVTSEQKKELLNKRIDTLENKKAKDIAKFLANYSFADRLNVYSNNGVMLVEMSRVLDALDRINQDEINYCES